MLLVQTPGGEQEWRSEIGPDSCHRWLSKGGVGKSAAGSSTITLFTGFQFHSQPRTPQLRHDLLSSLVLQYQTRPCISGISLLIDNGTAAES